MQEPNDQVSQPFVSHLIELRSRVGWALGSVLLVFICLSPWTRDIYSWFAAPLLASLPDGGTMLATAPHSTVFTPFKLTFAVAFALAVPMVLYQAWAFIAPGLYKSEKRIVLPLVFSTTILFYLGILFAYAVVFPMIFKFFALFAPDGVTYAPDIASYMSFALKMFFAFGIAFEVPVAVVILSRMGVISPDKMAQNRGYFILAAFVIAMLMTPPDPFSQIMLAGPVCLLFEIGLFFARKVEKKTSSNSDATDQ